MMAVRFYLHLKLWTISLDLELEVRVIRLLLTLFGKDQSEIPIDSRVTTAPQWVLRRDRFYFIVFKLIKNVKNQCLVELVVSSITINGGRYFFKNIREGSVACEISTLLIPFVGIKIQFVSSISSHLLKNWKKNV